MDRIPTRIDSTFRYVLLSARRAEQLMRGARPKLDTSTTKPTRAAIREINADVVEWNYGPPPAPPEPVEVVTDGYGDPNATE